MEQHAAEHNSSSPDFNEATLPATKERHERLPTQKLQLLWGDLLEKAVREPGLILEAYTLFHGYSLGNRLAALTQCHLRDLEPGPIHTYQGWQHLGRQVRSGEKALWLCMPLTRKIKEPGQDDADAGDLKTQRFPSRNKSHVRAASQSTTEPEPDDATGTMEVISAFAWKPHWFVLSQTAPIPGQEGATDEVPASVSSKWDKGQALQSLDIREVPFDHLDGNCQGFAKERSIAVSPLAALPDKTRFHEMAHVILGHTLQDECIDGAQLSRQVREVEAESVALLLLATLELPGQEYCRGYIQHWLHGEGISESSARRIFGAADKILSAGLTTPLSSDTIVQHPPQVEPDSSASKTVETPTLPPQSHNSPTAKATKQRPEQPSLFDL